jgi:hypothetical protein
VISRRAFLGTIAGSLLAGPLAAEAQQAGRMQRIGILVSANPRVYARRWPSITDGFFVFLCS